MDADQFVALLRDAVATDRELVRIGTVAQTFGSPASRATVRFDGESAASSKQYVAVSSLVPNVDGRVLLLRVGSSWVLIGELPT